LHKITTVIPIIELLTIEEAEQWLISRDGGTLKKKTGGAIFINGEAIGVWKVVKDV
jgi:hypothetical protein